MSRSKGSNGDMLGLIGLALLAFVGYEAARQGMLGAQAREWVTALQGSTHYGR